MKMNRKAKWLLLSMPFVLWIGWQGLERYDYATSDAIGRSAIDTERILRRYQATNDVKEIRDWILYGQTDGALGTQMHLTLGNWAVKNKEQLVTIIDSLPSKERANFIEVFASSLNQGAPQQFESAFANNKSPSIQKILKALATNRPQPW